MGSATGQATYLIDRERALTLRDVVAVVAIRQHGARSRIILADNSLHQTRTRPRTLVRALRRARGPVVEIGAKRPRVAYDRRGART